ncbi:MAG: DUF5797 family protein [Haloferacaceae archaeon]
MTDLSAEELDRLADVVRLQPTKNADLAERWGLAGGSEVHAYLESHLADYYYRDEDSYIRATPEAAELTGAEPGVVDDADGDPDVVRVSPLEARVLDVVVGAEERSESVVRVLHRLRDEFDLDPGAEAVRRALQSLKRTGLVEVERRTVPTFRRAPGSEEITVEEQADESNEAATEEAA